jgi:hypothetical protein
MQVKLLVLVSLLALAGTGGALADPRLDEVVYTPYVENHEAELEVRSARELGGLAGGDLDTVFEGEYGLNDRLSLALVGKFQRSAGQPLQMTGLGLEAVTYLGQIPGLGIDTGGYLEYMQGFRGEPDVIEGKLLLAKQVQRFQGLLNLIVERPVSGQGDQFASYGYAASATWRATGALRVGAEAFGDLGSDHAFGGRQGAYVGPQLLWEGRPGRGPVELGVDAGWLFPVGIDRTEARSQLRISLELGHRF